MGIGETRFHVIEDSLAGRRVQDRACVEDVRFVVVEA